MRFLILLLAGCTIVNALVNPCHCFAETCEKFVECMRSDYELCSYYKDYFTAAIKTNCDKDKAHLLKCADHIVEHKSVERDGPGKIYWLQRPPRSAEPNCDSKTGWDCDKVRRNKECLLKKMGKDCEAVYDINLEYICSGKSRGEFMKLSQLAEYLNDKEKKQTTVESAAVESVTSSAGRLQHYLLAILLSALLMAVF